jgi:hypothetical protein
MDGGLILICRHNEKIAAIRIDRSWNFVQVVNKVCDRWHHLDPESVVLSYSLVDNENLLLDNDDDLGTMFGLAENAGYEDIEVLVKDSTVGIFDIGNRDGNNENSEGMLGPMDYTVVQSIDGEDSTVGIFDLVRLNLENHFRLNFRDYVYHFRLNFRDFWTRFPIPARSIFCHRDFRGLWCNPNKPWSEFTGGWFGIYRK